MAWPLQLPPGWLSNPPGFAAAPGSRALAPLVSRRRRIFPDTDEEVSSSKPDLQQVVGGLRANRLAGLICTTV